MRWALLAIQVCVIHENMLCRCVLGGLCSVSLFDKVELEKAAQHKLWYEKSGATCLFCWDDFKDVDLLL